MEVSEKKSATLIRIAAVILIISALLAVLCHLADHIVREVVYNSIINTFRNLFGSFGLGSIMSFIRSLSDVAIEIICPVCAAAVAVFIFIKKEKLMGIVLIAWGVLLFLARFIDSAACYVTDLIGNGFQIGDIYYHCLLTIEYLILLAMLVCLGLLFLGKFKEKSKKIGFVLTGLFAIVCVISAREFFYGLEDVFYAGGGLYRVILSFLEDLILPLTGVLIYVAHTMISFAGAVTEHPAAPAVEKAEENI